jgi:hypothetical protein
MSLQDMNALKGIPAQAGRMPAKMLALEAKALQHQIGVPDRINP